MKESMTKVALLAIVLLVSGALFVPAVSAMNVYELPYNVENSKQTYTSYMSEINADSTYVSNSQDQTYKIKIDKIENYQNLHYIRLVVNKDLTGFEVGQHAVFLPNPQDMQNLIEGYYICHKYTNILGQIVKTDVVVFFPDWNVTGVSGSYQTTLRNADKSSIVGGYYNRVFYPEGFTSSDDPNNKALFYIDRGTGTIEATSIFESYQDSRYALNVSIIDDTVADNFKEVNIELFREATYSTIQIYNSVGEILQGNQGLTNENFRLYLSELYKINVTTNLLDDEYYFLLGQTPDVPGDPTPTPTEEPTVLRTGTVTMTDNNGTTISGFEVTAENAYTEESFTVVTETDVAVMTLPMERTIQIRNPQTGVYEEAPVGYYRFYGQAPGYKMLYEDGIQVSVMPEKYGSYQVCDIGVTSESGYLTGKHQFQIRSRSDNSILQSGTISAKSATTDEWFNTTVSGGIASLILPYDTSNVQSQYAGNYYVYATSPGYEDSDYGTQITVMPHTVSEKKIILLTPIGGVPTAGNVTLRIQAFSEDGPGVVNAEIFIVGVQGAGASLWDTYTASSTGYLAVSVPGNSTYDIVASGAGYYDSARRVEVFTEDPSLIEIKLYLSGAPTLEPTTHPTGWPTDHPTTQPTGGIPDEDDDSEGFLMQAVRGIGLTFGVGFSTAKLIFGMLLALSIGYTTAKQLRGGAAEFGLGLLGGTMLGVLIGLLPVWIIVVLLLVVGLYIGNRYVGGGNHG